MQLFKQARNYFFDSKSLIFYYPDTQTINTLQIQGDMMSQTKKEPGENRIGQHFLKAGLVNQEQLAIALKRQGQTGERIGSILLRLGYITTEKLLDFLKDFYNTPSLDLFRLTIEDNVLSSISHDQMCRFQAIPILNSHKFFFIAMADPNDIDSVNELEFIIGKKLQPVAVPHAQLHATLEYLRQKGGKIIGSLSGETVEREMAGSDNFDMKPDIDTLLKQLIKYNASDILLSAGLPPCLKVNNEVQRLPLPSMTPSDVELLARGMMTDEQWKDFSHNSGIDFGLLRHEIGRFRVNIYRQRSSVSISIRGIAEHIPSLHTLGFGDQLDEYVNQPQGLILVTGPTGHGKSTTVAAIVDAINARRKCNIITIEDPIEFLHKHKMSNINQREVGRDTPSFREGLRHIFRQAPDVIVIGEMRDNESFEIAVQAAGTGHLVISTMHANTTTAAMERVVDMFSNEKQDQIRSQLAEALLVCIGQRLVPLKNGKGRIMAYEKLASSSRIKNLIRENKCHQIRTFFQQSAEEYMPIDMSLANLVRTGKITMDEGLKYCDNAPSFKVMATQSGNRPGN